MISVILHQIPLLSTLLCICLWSYIWIWCRIISHWISHWICVLVPAFVLASLLSKWVWLAKFLVGDHCFPSQRAELLLFLWSFAIHFSHLAPQFPLFYPGSQWCPQCHQIERGQKRKWGEGEAPSFLLLPQEQKVLLYYPQISPCSSIPAIFFRTAKIQFVCTSEKPGAFPWCHQTKALSALCFS